MRSGLLTAIGAVGALATVVGAWPLLSGRNFTRNGEVRPRRAPAALWRAGGAMVSTGGLLLVALALVMGSSATVGDAQAIGVAIMLVLSPVAWHRGAWPARAEAAIVLLVVGATALLATLPLPPPTTTIIELVQH